MKKANYSKRASMAVMVLSGAAILFSGCSTPLQTRHVETSEFLGDYSKLKPGEKGEAHLLYISPDADFSKYTKIQIDPIRVFGKATRTGLLDLPDHDLKGLLDYLDATVREQVGKDYQLVDKSGPDVMKLRIAVTEGKGANVIANTISSIIPIGLAIDFVKWGFTGKHMAVGEASLEMELQDSVSNEMLAAAVDGRAGRKSIISGNFKKWGDVQDAFDYWAGRLAVRLGEFRTR
jgi:hypothetical protein